MRVTLRVENGPYRGRTIRIAVSEIHLGRGQECQIRLPDKSVSRLHCTLSILQGEVIVRDESSVHGTFVNRRRLRGEWQLEDGDRLQVGPFVFTVSITRDEFDPADSELVFDEPQTTRDGSTRIGIEVQNPNELDATEEARIRGRLSDLE